MSKGAVNNFVPNYVPENLKWSERDGLLIYIDQYSEFSSDPDIYLKEAKVVSFDMMHARCTGDKQSSIDKHYQTVVSDDVKNMPQKGKKRPFLHVRSDRKDLCKECSHNLYA